MKIRFNLLPLQQKKHLHTQKVFRLIMEQEIYVIIVVGIFLACLFAMFILLQAEAVFTKEADQESADHLGLQEITDIHATFKSVHQKVDSLTVLQEKHYNWSRVFVLMSENMIDGVIVEELTTSDNHIKLRAVADKRETVVSLKEKMRDVQWEQQKCFENVVVPESELAKPTNLTFTMTFDINIICLQ